MFDGFAGRSVARGGRALVEMPGPATDETQRADRQDRAAAAKVRPTDAAPAAVVQLSAEGRQAMIRGRGPPPPDADLVDGDEDDDPPPPAPQRRRPPAIVTEALARYRQLAYEPESTFVSEESPFSAQARGQP